MRKKFDEPVFATENTLEDYSKWGAGILFSKWMSIELLESLFEPHQKDIEERIKIGEAINRKYLPERLETYNRLKNCIHKELFRDNFLVPYNQQI